jgi:hypothetical protein
VGYWLAVQGRIELAQKKLPLARGHLERAIRLIEPSGVMVEDLARARFDLARALWESGADRRRARDLAEQARRGLSEAGSTDRLPEIDAWLRARPAPPD